LFIGFYVSVSSLSVLVIPHVRQTKTASSVSTFDARNVLIDLIWFHLPQMVRYYNFLFVSAMLKIGEWLPTLL